MPTPFSRPTQMRLLVSSSSYSSTLGMNHVAKRLDLLFKPFVGLVLQTADAEGMGGEARAAIFLEDLEDLLALAQAVEDGRDGADIEGVGAEPKEVAGDAVQFGEDDADCLSAGGRFDVEKLFDREAVAQAVGNGGDVIHAVDIGGELLIGAVFADLFDAAVEVADDALGASLPFRHRVSGLRGAHRGWRGAAGPC